MRDIATLLFQEDFARPAPAPPPPPSVPPPPMFDDTDMAAARAAGYDAGERAGRAAAAADVAARTVDALSVIAERLDALHDEAMQSVEVCATALARLLLGALGSAFPTLCARHGEAELCRVIATVMPALLRETGVVVRVHPALAGAVTAALAGVPARTAPPPAVEPDATLAPGDVRIAWNGGGAARDSAATWRAVADVLQPLGLLPMPPDDGVTDAG